MADDFDKDKDDEFASEFDFVDEVPAGDNQGGGSKPPSANSSAVKGVLIVLSVLGIGYFGYSKFFGAKDELPSPPVAEVPAATDLPLPTESEQPPAPESLEQAFGNNGASDQLSAAVPSNAKTFEQLQADMQNNKNIAQQQTIPPTTVVPNELQDRLNSLAEEMTVNVNQISQLQATIASLAVSIEDLNRSIAAMDNRVLGLTETVDGLSQDLSNVKKLITAEDLDLTMPASMKVNKAKKTGQPITNNAPSYTVHAIIPGRAWLKSSSGQIITVTEGDRVGDYGTVAVIDAASGIVRTSSGITFK